MLRFRRLVALVALFSVAAGALFVAPPAPARADAAKRYPIIFLPGFGGTFLLSDRNPFTGACGTGNYIIWLDGAQVKTSWFWNDLHRLKLKEDGLTNADDPCLRVGPVMREAAITTNEAFDVNLRKWLGLPAIYRGLTDWLNRQGYNEGPNGWLELFPYDFRKSADYNADLLEPVVSEVLRRTGAPKVILLAHSYGGLIGRTYVARHGGDKVAALVTMGTPYLGSPRIAQAMTVGWDFGTGLDKGWAKDLAPNWPAAYHFMPGDDYFNAYGPEGFYVEDHQDTGQYLASRQFQTNFFRRYNARLYDETQAWRRRTFDRSDHGVRQVVIAGFTNDRSDTVDVGKLDEEPHDLTMIRFKRVWKETCVLWVICRSEDKGYALLGGGDNTVPLRSALLGQNPSYPHQSVSGPHRVDASVMGAFEYWLVAGTQAKHSDLPNLPDMHTILYVVLDQVQSEPPRIEVDKTTGIVIKKTINITTQSLPLADAGVPYSAQFEAAGGKAPYSWSVTEGTLPPGMALDPTTGTISGTTRIQGSVPFRVGVVDAEGVTGSALFSITISAGPLKVVTGTLPDGITKTRYSQAVWGSGGFAPYKWSVAGGTLPPGLSLLPSAWTSQGVSVDGTPREAGEWTFTLQMQDGAGKIASQDYKVKVAYGQIRITTDALPTGTVDKPYTETLASVNGNPPYTWKVISGTLPGGIALTPYEGRFFGTPWQHGSFRFTVQVQDGAGEKDTRELAMTVDPGALTVATERLWAVQVGQPYTATLGVRNGTAPYRWSLAQGALPEGVALDAGTGTLSGTPGQAGTFAFTVKVRDAGGQWATRELSLAVEKPPGIKTGALPRGQVGVPYSATLEATDARPPVTWNLSRLPLPRGLYLDRATGTIAGTPAEDGSFPLQVEVSDGRGKLATRSLTLTVDLPAGLAVTTAELPAGRVEQAYTATLAAAGGTPPYTWSLRDGDLPPGLALDRETGALAGTPDRAGVYGFTVAVRDRAYNGAAQRLSVTVRGAPEPVSDAPRDLRAAVAGNAVVLNWQSPAGAAGDLAGYHVLRGARAESLGTTPVNGAPVTMTSYTDMAVRPGTTYFYQAVPVYAGGRRGAASNTASVTLPAALSCLDGQPGGTAFGAPRTGMIGAVGGNMSSGYDFGAGVPLGFGRGDLSLDGNELAAYQIQDLGAGNFQAALAYADTGWQAAVPAVAGHVYVVKTAGGQEVQVALGPLERSTYGGTGFSFRWAAAVGTNKEAASDQPAAVAARAGAGGIALTWQAQDPPPCGLAGYAVARGTAPGGAGRATLATVRGSPYTDPVTAPGTYYYTVTPVYVDGHRGTASAEVSAVVPAGPGNGRDLEPVTPVVPVTPVTPVCQPAPGGTTFGAPREGGLGAVGGLINSGFDFGTGGSVTYGRGDLSLSDAAPWTLYAREIRDLGAGSFSATLAYSDTGWQPAVPAAENHVYLVRTATGQVVQVVTGQFERSPYGSTGLPFRWAAATGTKAPVTCDGGPGAGSGGSGTIEPATSGTQAACPQGTLRFGTGRTGALGAVDGLISSGFDFSTGAGLTYGRGDLSLGDGPPLTLHAGAIQDLGAGGLQASLAYSDTAWQTSVPLQEHRLYLVRTAGGQLVQVATGTLQASPYGSAGIPFTWAVTTGQGCGP